MAGIPGDLVFVLIFVAISVLEGVGRKKKAAQKGLPGTVPGPQRRSAQKRESAAPQVEAGVAEASVQSMPTQAPEPAASEGLIPKDVWEEILGLARGTAPEPRRVEEPVEEAVEEAVEESSWTAYQREDRTSEVIPDFEAQSLESLEPMPEVVRPVAVGSRAPSVPSKSDVLPTSEGRRVVSVRGKLLGHGSVAELRRAIILKEVLDPPVSMRE